MDSSCAYDCIAVVGTGGLGWHILASLLQTKRLRVRAVTRANGDPAKQRRLSKLRALGADVIEYDTPTCASFARAFAGVHTVISAVGMAGVDAQLAMVDGVLAAGVRWFVPSEFGVAHYASAWLPVASPLEPKRRVRRYLAEHAQPRGMAHTVVYTGLALDYLDPSSLGLKLGSRSATLVGRGGSPVSFTALADIVALATQIALRPREFCNRTVRFAGSTAKLRELVKIVTNGDRGENVKIVSIDEAKLKFCELARRQDVRAFQIYSRLLIEEGLGQVNRDKEPLDNALFPELAPEHVRGTLARLLLRAEHAHASEDEGSSGPKDVPAHRAATDMSVTDGLGRPHNGIDL
ncbi:hypothetical protein IWW50_003407 [Coemansia erecta]|nr:hypothetical protein GGF43_001147 [Coemansia sp. RSA 2618]KAJ2824281.1 hypothetical protein IWW50_003407 [Coemansia erecta]